MLVEILPHGNIIIGTMHVSELIFLMVPSVHWPAFWEKLNSEIYIKILNINEI